MATYSKSSAYYSTPMYGTFLDILSYRSIPAVGTDVAYTIDSFYKYRPDLLAGDLYDNPALWWVFAVRNPDVLKDPVFDFYPGQTIYIPKKETLVASLGV